MVVKVADQNARLRRYASVDLVNGMQELDTRKEQEELLESGMERRLKEVRLLRRKLN
jgi:hypothetical protein